MTAVRTSLFLLLLALASATQMETPEPVLLIYETSTDWSDVQHTSALNHASFMTGQASEHSINFNIVGTASAFDGWGSKAQAIMPVLHQLAPNTLVIVSDSRDVLLNPGQSKSGVLRRFEQEFEMLVRDDPGAIVVSAESQCCVSALSYHSPGDLIGSDGSRTQRACNSGQSDCLHQGEEFNQPWVQFMQELAEQRGAESAEVFLNAGLVAGRAGDLLRVLSALQLDNSEDDQAVLTDLLFRRPEWIVLDYAQRLFGNNRWSQGLEKGCMFEHDETTGTLVQKIRGTRPLFVHTSGKFYTCLHQLAASLGYFVDEAELEAEMHSHLRRLNYAGDTTTTTAATTAMPATTVQPDTTTVIVCDEGFSLVGDECQSDTASPAAQAVLSQTLVAVAAATAVASALVV